MPPRLSCNLPHLTPRCSHAVASPVAGTPRPRFTSTAPIVEDLKPGPTMTDELAPLEAMYRTWHFKPDEGSVVSTWPGVTTDNGRVARLELGGFEWPAGR